jgi:hypothetical protein
LTCFELPWTPSLFCFFFFFFFFLFFCLSLGRQHGSSTNLFRKSFLYHLASRSLPWTQLIRKSQSHPGEEKGGKGKVCAYTDRIWLEMMTGVTQKCPCRWLLSIIRQTGHQTRDPASQQISEPETQQTQPTLQTSDSGTVGRSLVALVTVSHCHGATYACVSLGKHKLRTKYCRVYICLGQFTLRNTYCSVYIGNNLLSSKCWGIFLKKYTLRRNRCPVYIYL